MRLVGKVALVTGAGRGIGRVLALGMARHGADVVLNDLANDAGAAEAAAEIERLGRRALVVRADVSRPAEIRAMFTRVREAFGRLDTLVNNAGITIYASVFDTTEEQWDQVVATNLKGTFFCSIEAARLMRERGGGSIVNVSTNTAQLGVKNLAAYAASKGGIHALTKQLAVELAPHKIRVNTFGPGPINVERNLRDDPDYHRTWGSMTPMNRIGEPEELVGPAVFLASEEASFVTGQIFFADGGWTASGRTPVEAMDRALERSGGKVH